MSETGDQVIDNKFHIVEVVTILVLPKEHLSVELVLPFGFFRLRDSFDSFLVELFILDQIVMNFLLYSKHLFNKEFGSILFLFRTEMQNLQQMQSLLR